MTERRLTVLEARRDFGNLVLDAQAGNVTVITRYGKPAAVLQPVGGQPDSRGERVIELPGGGALTVSLNGPIISLGTEDREFVFDVIDQARKFAADVAERVKAYGAQPEECRDGAA